MKKLSYQSVLLLGVLIVTGCSDNKAYETSICALADVSGAYASEKSNMMNIIKAGLLPQMVPGDSIFLIMIDSNSYAEDNLISKMTLAYRPTEANKQKLIFSKGLDKFAKGKDKSKLTDISGAMMLCSDYLKDTRSGTQLMFIFSDMKEELPAGVKRNFKKDEFTGMDIAAMNVIKLNKDSDDPEIYRKRLEGWEKRLGKSGVKSWATLIDVTKLSEYVRDVKS